MKTNSSGWLQVSRATASFCAFFLAAFVPTSARAACVTATAGNVWHNTALSAVQTHTFTAYYDATPSASPINAFVGLSKGAPTDFTGFAVLVRFSPTGQIDARNGGAFAAASVIPYSAGYTYHFRVAVNVATHTYSIYVTPPGGSELTVGINYAFRTEQNKVTQLDHWGVHVDPSNGGSLTVCNFSMGVPTAPVFSPAGGTYTGAQSVTITSTDATAIYYTTNGTTPTTSSSLYTGAVSLPLGTTTLKAIAVNANGSSTVTTGVYILNPPAPLTPAFSPAGGTSTSAQSVTITSAGATSIYYTTDGSTPTTASTNYTVPVTIANNTVLKAIGVNSGGTSPVGTASFTILPPAPVFSPTPGTYTNVITFSVTISDAASSTIYYTTDGSTPTTSSTPYTAAVSLPLGTTTLSAIAVTANGSSTVTVGTYILTPPPPSTPVFSPAGGSFTSAQSVSITSLGATAIYYTTDGTAPTTSSTLYSGAISISNNTVLNAIGVNSGGHSPVGTASFTILPPAPSFSPTPGTYTDVTTFSVTISDAASATIYYTTDGSTPTTASTQYSTPVSLPLGTTTLNAIAVTANGSSAVTAGTYILTPPPPLTPVFSPAGGSFMSGQSVTITSLGATAIYYTTDGTAPTTSSTLYSGAITVSNNAVLNAIGINSGGNSAVGTASFTILPPAPSFSPTPGTYTDVTTFSVTISDAASATIYYTTDGSTPTTASTQYSTPVSLPLGTTTLNAIAVTANGSSAVTAGTYILTPPPPLTPVFSPAGGSFMSGQSVTITSLGATAIYYTTDGTAPTTSSTLYSGAITVSNNAVLNAIGINSGGNSAVGTASFTILPPAPSFSPAPGTYTNVTTFYVTIGNAVSATIYYTTDGSTPTTASTQYSMPVSLPIGTTTLSAIAVTANGSSAVTAGTYILTPTPPQTPVFSPAGGSFTSAQSVSITSLGADSIYYTTDGSTPSPSSTLYSGAITVSNNTVLNAIGINSGGTSPVGTESFNFVASAPVFSPASGTFIGPITVTIISATANVTISYTTDGSMPSETNGTLYSGPVSISGNTTLQAIAYRSGFTDSSVSSAIYTIAPMPAPTFSPAGGSYATPQTVTISDSIGNAFILYTTDGSTPSATNGHSYTGPVFISQPTNLQAIAYTFGAKDGTFVYSSVTSANYAIASMPAPVFSPAGGSYSTAQSVTITDTFPGALINYTTDGTTPTESHGTNYSHALLISQPTTINAIAFYPGYIDSSITSATYTIAPVPAPVFSPAGGPYATAQTVTITDALQGALINYTTDGTTPTESHGTNYSHALLISQPTTINAIAFYPGYLDSSVAIATYTIAPVPAPVFSPVGGSYSTAQSVTITDALQGALINYTTDGTTPTESHGTNYSHALLISQPTTINAIAFYPGYLDSSVAIATYTIAPVPAPVFSPVGGSYSTAQSVTITDALPSALINYTTDGTAPSETHGKSYNGPLFIGQPTTINAIAFFPGYLDSSVTIATYTIVPSAAAPVFSPAAGTYASAQTISITSATGGATIRYTIDGSTPTETNGTIYSGPVNISITTTLNAFAYETGFADSPVTSGLYAIDPPAAAPVFSPPAGTYASAQLVTITSTTIGATIQYTTDGSTPTETNGTVCSGSISINGTTMLKAIAFVPGIASDSPVTSGLYTITNSPAAVLNVLYDFNSSNNGGYYPEGNLVLGSDGNFYGATSYGGSSGGGTVFMMTPAGVVATMVSLGGASGLNYPENLVQGSDGNFYGTTYFYGGSTSSGGGIFEMTPAGDLTTLVSFTGANGSNPVAAPVQGNDGSFYGTTQNGGSSGYGTVFKLTPSGDLTTLVSFDVGNGAGPIGGLVQGSDGNFYGTTIHGGSGSYGTVFKMTPAGALTTLVSFNGANGMDPVAALVQGSDGNFYGTTEGPGASAGGTIFKITPTGALTTMAANMAYPVASLLQGNDGNFYGTTNDGGSFGVGAIFRMTPAGVLTTLISFDGANGARPVAALVQGSDGNFYGTISEGGISGNGIIFQLIVPPAQ